MGLARLPVGAAAPEDAGRDRPQAQGVVWLAAKGARVPAGMPAVIVGAGRPLRRGQASRAVRRSRRIERVSRVRWASRVA
ncbi:MAG: hypothetical protein M3Y73_04790, partial [Actinomycetota bacterium]|nr:hypothetical protein [Actinomycetota bacterium]